jgi:uncharacterized protein (DUF1778 family)
MSQQRQRTTAARQLVTIRVSSADRNVIDRAAQLAGKTRSEFMLEASRRAAQEALLDTTPFLVDGPTFKRFKALLDAPPKRMRVCKSSCAGEPHGIRPQDGHRRRARACNFRRSKTVLPALGVYRGSVQSDDRLKDIEADS